MRYAYKIQPIIDTISIRVCIPILVMTFLMTGWNVQACPDITVITESVDIPCYGINGLVKASGAGGEEPYTYRWNTGDSTSAIEVPEAGIYYVTVTDKNGCQGTANVIVFNFPVVCSPAEVTDESCFQSCDGTIKSNVAGGTEPYTFLWSNGATDRDLTGLCPGSYTLTATDANDCKSEFNVKIYEAPEFLLTIKRRSDTLLAVAEGGASPFIYSWNTGDTTSWIVPAADEYYSVTVTDANGCEIIASYHNLSSGKLKLFPNPVKNIVSVEIPETKAGTVYIYDINGKIVKRSSSLLQIDIESIPHGLYFIYVLTENTIYSGKMVK